MSTLTNLRVDTWSSGEYVAPMEIQLRDGVLQYDEADHELVMRFAPWFSSPSSDKRRVYAMTKFAGRTLYVHRLLLPEGRDIDHINGDGLDNRRANLRAATRAQNMANSGSRRGSRSPYKGVTLHKKTGQWFARIMVDGKAKYLGYYKDPEAAARAYDTAALEVWGEFAFLNFPRE